MTIGLVGQDQITTFTSPVNGTSPIDANVVKGNDNTIKTQYNSHDADATIHFQSSTNAARPTFGTQGRKWLDTDTLRAYYDTGVAWSEFAYLSTGGGTVSGNLAVTGTLDVAGVSTLGPAANFGDILQASASIANSRIMSYAAAGNPVFVGRRSNGTTSLPTDAPNGGGVLQLLGEAYSGGLWFTSGSVQILVDGTFTTGQAPPSRIDFFTNIANGSPTLALSIKKDQTATFAAAVTSAGTILAGAASQLGWTSGSRLTSPSDGSVNIYASDGTTLGNLFGATVSATTGAVIGATSGYLNVGGNAGTNAVGRSIVFLNVASAPAGNPTSGGFLWVEAGALKYRGTSGTVTTVAVA